MDSRNQNIDLVKIIAMFGVLCLHSNIGKQDSIIAYVMTSIAGISIPLFFMSSGYVLWNRSVDYYYSWRKIKGIVRFCFIICFLYWLIFDIVKGSWPTEVIHDFCEGFFQGGHLWMFWYFGAMIILYLLLPILNNLNSKYSNFCFFFIVFSFLCVTISFLFNVNCDFERRYINQTLRLWNWLFYFGLGGLICRVEQKQASMVSRKFFPLLFIGCLFGFVLFRILLKEQLLGIEYYFGSIPCALYAVATFVFLVRMKIRYNRWIPEMSKLFLPVYALHWTVLMFIRNHDISFCGSFSPLVDFVILSVIVCLFSWILMKIPYVKSIFII